jgi:hypothetical protein
VKAGSQAVETLILEWHGTKKTTVWDWRLPTREKWLPDRSVAKYGPTWPLT